MKRSSASEPSHSTPVFDQATLPAALRRKHRTKPGVWGVIRMLEAQVQLSFMDPPQTKILARGSPGLLLPDQPHLVEPIGACACRSSSTNDCPRLDGPPDSMFDAPSFDGDQYFGAMPA